MGKLGKYCPMEIVGTFACLSLTGMARGNRPGECSGLAMIHLKTAILAHECHLSGQLKQQRGISRGILVSTGWSEFWLLPQTAVGELWRTAFSLVLVYSPTQ